MLDPNSPTWRWLVEWMTQRREYFRERNEIKALSPDETNYLRGQIAMCKELLDLPAQQLRDRQSSLTTGDE